MICTREELFPCEHLCKDAADRPHVDGRGVRLSPHKQLWSAVPASRHIGGHTVVVAV